MLWYWLMMWILNSITYNIDKFLRFPSSEGIFPDNWLFDKFLNNNQCYDIDWWYEILDSIT